MNTIKPRNDPIDVIVHHHSKGITPIRFRWNNRIYRIKAVNSSWNERISDRRRIFHLNCETRDDEYVEIALDTESLRWELRYYVPKEGLSSW